MKKEWKAQEELKLYLNRVLSLRPVKNLSTQAFLLFKVGKEMLEEISENAGHCKQTKRFLNCFCELTEGQKQNLPLEEGKIVDMVLEGIEWIGCISNRWSELFSIGLHGDEMFWALDFAMMTDKEIEEGADPDPLARLKSIGVDIKPKELINQKKEQHNVVSPVFDVWMPLEKLAKEANSDFFDYVSDETLNVISNNTDLLDEVFEEYLGEEEHLKNIMRGVCPNNFAEKWKLFLKVVIQAIYNSNVLSVQVDEIAKPLPFISDMKWIWDTLEIKIDRFDPKLIYLFGNLGADEYGEEDGWFTPW